MVKFRIIDAALLVATIIGAVMAVSSARKLHGLQAEHARLSRTTGELAITDPAQLHVQALQIDEPLHFAWRVYEPVGQIAVRTTSGSGSSSSSNGHNSQPREFIARIRFSENPSGQMALYRTFGSSSSFWSWGSPDIVRFIQEHHDELDIEQLGAEELARVKPGESATLLRVRLPEKLIEKVRQTFGDSSAGQLTPHILECTVKVQP